MSQSESMESDGSAIEVSNLEKSLNHDLSIEYASKEVTHEVVIPKRRWFWRAYDQNKLRWDLWIMFLATVNWFQTPYVVAFVDVETENPYLDALDFVIDTNCMIDVVVNFRTSCIIESTNDEEFGLK